MWDEFYTKNRCLSRIRKVGYSRLRRLRAPSFKNSAAGWQFAAPLLIFLRPSRARNKRETRIVDLFL